MNKARVGTRRQGKGGWAGNDKGKEDGARQQGDRGCGMGTRGRRVGPETRGR